MREFIVDLTNGFTNPLTIVAQLVGLIPLVVSSLMFMFTSRRKIVAAKAVSDMLWSLHYFMLGAPAGCITNAINTVRDIVFFHKDKKWANHKLVPVAFCIVTVVFTAAGGDGVKCLLPMVGSCLAVIGFWCNDAANIRRFNFPAILPVVDIWCDYRFGTYGYR